MVTEALFTGLVLLVAVQRLFELRLSRKNERALRARGAQEHAPGHFRAMSALHSSWFFAMLLEVYLLRPAFSPWLATSMFAVLLGGQALRYAAIKSLGSRWSVRILTLPGSEPVQTGIYRFLRHPNYVGVMLELFALPLIHSAWRTALVFSLLNAAILWVRIRAEERALALAAGSEHARSGVPRFFPAIR